MSAFIHFVCSSLYWLFFMAVSFGGVSGGRVYIPDGSEWSAVWWHLGYLLAVPSLTEFQVGTHLPVTWPPAQLTADTSLGLGTSCIGMLCDYN